MANVSGHETDSLNVELNLVPFIDLLSSLVLFLLISAVWLQVGTVPVGAESSGRSAASATPKQTLNVHIKEKSYELSWTGAKPLRPLPKSVARTGAKDEALALQLTLESAFGDKLPEMAAVSGDDQVPYKSIIAAVDALKAIAFPSVAINTD